MIFPTHRLAASVNGPSPTHEDVEAALHDLDERPRDHSAAVLYRREGELAPWATGSSTSQLVEARRRRRRRTRRSSRRRWRRRPRRGRGGFLVRPLASRGRLRGRRARRDDAPEEHVLLSQARLRPALPPARRMTPWLELCRAAVGDLREVLRGDADPGRAGAGGRRRRGETRRPPSTRPPRLRSWRASRRSTRRKAWTSISSPRSSASETFGQRPEARVIVDPIDGSLNAKREHPVLLVSIAVAEGPTMKGRCVRVRPRLGTGEEWTAGAWGGGTLERRAARRASGRGEGGGARRSRRHVAVSVAEKAARVRSTFPQAAADHGLPGPLALRAWRRGAWTQCAP